MPSGVRTEATEAQAGIAETKSVDELGIDWNDFFARWTKARVSALRKVIGNEKQFGDPEQSEVELLDLLSQGMIGYPEEETEARKTQLLRLVFDHSRMLGLGLVRSHQVAFDLGDIRDILKKSGMPCLQGTWESRATAQILTRKGCNFCVQARTLACDYWREALDGLVMGMGEHERYVRHAAVRHGDALCVDVFFADGAGKKEPGLAWGDIPEPMLGVLTAIAAGFVKKHKAPVELRGIREGVLYYVLKEATDGQCGHGGSLVARFAEEVKQVYPGLHLREVTPRAVLGVDE